MKRLSPISKNRDALAIVLLIVWHLVYFFPVTLAQQVWFTTDILRLYFPFSLELASALNAGHLPLWTPGILAGFPLLAEGQVGALYPVNWFLFKLLPVHLALSVGNLLHLAFAACGMYILARSLGFRAASALFAGFVFSFNGVVFGHLSHMSVIAAMAWLPWALLFLTRFQRAQNGARAGVWFFLGMFSIAMQFLSGSVQIAFFGSLAFAAIGIAGAWLWRGEYANARNGREPIKQIFLSTALPLALGVGVAAIQLVPTAELVGYSVRSETNASFYTSYSLPPEFLLQFILPYFQGEPSEGTGEYWSYIAIAPFLLMILAPILRRDRHAIFYFAFALVALSLALGGSNPLFQLLYRLPIFGLFRVPARYLFLFVLAAAILSARALDGLANRLESSGRFPHWSIVWVVPVLAAIFLAHTQPLEFWLEVWRVLPIPLAVFSIAAIALALARKMAREDLLALVFGVTVFDLAMYMPPFLNTIDALSPVSAAATSPRSLFVLQSLQTSERVWTDLSVFPSTPALRASMFPNTSLIYGVQSAQAYTSLSFARHEVFLSAASPAMLNLFNARYVTVPLEPRSETQFTTPSDSFFLDIRKQMTIVPTLTSFIEISSFTEQAENVADGTAVGEIVVRFRDGGEAKFPLRVGIETADWDYNRKSGINHSQPRGARSFPAFWRAFGKTFQGHTYLARLTFPDGKPREITAMKLDPLSPNAWLTIERVTLGDGRGNSRPLATLAGKNDFTLAYLSDTVAIWENRDALPRAFLAHSSEIANDDAAFARLRDPAFQPNRVALLSEGNKLTPRADASGANDKVEIKQYEPERVTLAVQSDAPGYLILTDSWYPGWQANVDGNPAPIYRADVIFRAVPIEPGNHTVVFEYQPISLRVGALVSATSLVAAMGIALVLRRKSDSGV